MNDHNIIFADPWLKKAKGTAKLPDDAVFACAYYVHLVIDYLEEAVFFRRTETCDELWRATTDFDASIEQALVDGKGAPKALGGQSGLSIGRVYAAETTGEESSSCLALLERLFRAYVGGLESPQRFLVAGIISESAYNNLVQRIEHKLHKNSRKAHENETEIVKVARRLGLSPRPSGKHPDLWQANCPGSHHTLFLEAAENHYTCPWCSREGSAKELRALVKERKGQPARP
ncbi:MAG: hypothetical protein ACXVI1_11225 [Halobacteriota archaeon]